VRTLLSLLVTVAALALIAPAAASARRLNPTSFGSVEGSAVTDGRYAAWGKGGSVFRVYDSTTGQTRDFTADIGALGCDPAVWGPLTLAIGGGKLMFVCSSGEKAEVVDIATAATQMPQSGVDSNSAGLFRFRSVGAYWTRGVEDGYHYSGIDSFVPLSSEAKQAGTHWDDPTFVADLDTPELWRPLCQPLAREPNPDYDVSYDINGMPFLPFQYRGSYGLTDSKKGLVLKRCGSTRRVRLAKAATSFDLRPSMVAWVVDDTVHVRNLISGRDWIWRVKRTSSVTVALTDTHVFITASDVRGRRVLVQPRPR
jgi:hypothetical protein